MSSENKEETIYRFLHRLAGRRLTAPPEIVELLAAAGEKKVLKFGSNHLFVTKVKKVAEYLKKLPKYGTDFNYIASQKELDSIQEEAEASKFITEFLKMPNIDYEMVLESCNDIQTKAWAKQYGIIVANNTVPIKAETLKKKILEYLKENSLSELELEEPAEKLQPQDFKPQSETLKKGDS